MLFSDTVISQLLTHCTEMYNTKRECFKEENVFIDSMVEWYGRLRKVAQPTSTERGRTTRVKLAALISCRSIVFFLCYMKPVNFPLKKNCFNDTEIKNHMVVMIMRWKIYHMKTYMFAKQNKKNTD